MRPISSTLAITVACCALSVGVRFSSAQSFTPHNAQPGQPLIEAFVSGTSSPTTDPFGTYLDAFVYVPSGGGTSICKKISGAFSDAVTTGGVSAVTIDARGFLPTDTALSCGSDSPFPSQLNMKGRLLLGAYTITTSREWVVPDGVEVVGLGPSAVGLNTMIQATSGFSSFTGKGALIEMGGGTSGQGPSDAKLRGVTVDCNNLSSNSGDGCIYGIMNDAGIDNTWVQDVVIKNAPVGLMIAVSAPTAGGADSGTYRNINVQYSSVCCNSASPYAVGVEMVGADDGTLVRGIEDVTISGCNLTGATSPVFGVYVNGASTKIANVNTECFPTGVQVGCSTSAGDTCGVQDTTHNVEVDNTFLHCTTNCGTAVGLAIASNAYNVSATTITGTAATGNPLTNLITWSGTPGTVSGNFEGSFFLGDPNQAPTCTSNCLGLFTTDQNVPWVVPNSITQ